MIALAYDSRSPFPVQQPPLALEQRLRSAVAAAYTLAAVLRTEKPDVAMGMEVVGKEIEQLLAEYEAEMKGWQARLAARAEALAREQIEELKKQRGANESASALPLHSEEEL